MHALVALGNGEALALEVEIGWRGREHLAQAKPTPVEQLKGYERLWFIHNLAAEAQVLVLSPKAHLVSLLAADLADFCHGIRLESVVTNGMVQHGGKLVAYRMQVGLRVFEAVARAYGYKLVFPIEDVECGDLVHALMS